MCRAGEQSDTEQSWRRCHADRGGKKGWQVFSAPIFFPSLVVYVKFSLCVKGEMQWWDSKWPLMMWAAFIPCKEDSRDGMGGERGIIYRRRPKPEYLLVSSTKVELRNPGAKCG